MWQLLGSNFSLFPMFVITICWGCFSNCYLFRCWSNYIVKVCILWIYSLWLDIDFLKWLASVSFPLFARGLCVLFKGFFVCLLIVCPNCYMVDHYKQILARRTLFALDEHIFSSKTSHASAILQGVVPRVK